jgi:crossover junction endodeoxyribonuclease RusA
MPSHRRRTIALSSRALLPRTSLRRGTILRPRGLSSASVKATSSSSPLSQLNSNAGRHPPPNPAQVTADNFTITLPVPPSINHQYATVNGRRLLSSTGRAYKAQVGQQVWVALAQSPCTPSFRNSLRSGSLALSIRFYFATSLRRDLDGGLKIAQDAVCEGLDVNDNRIIETHLYKHVDKTNPRIEVSLSCLSPSPHES